jgi:uncharacterized protein YndB with AHSA1/START domain
MESITVETIVNAPIEKVWQCFTEPEHIVHWNNASDDWHTPKAENDLRVGGRFVSRMEAKDGSFGFDYYGVYEEIKDHELIAYTLGEDLEAGRKVRITFNSQGDQTAVSEDFTPETTHPLEMQRAGWQSILDNFKKYVEGIQ